MTAKLSITVPDEVERSARAAAEAAGKPLSTWIAEACEREAYRQGIAHDAGVIAQAGLLGDDWAVRQAAVTMAVHGQR